MTTTQKTNGTKYYVCSDSMTGECWVQEHEQGSYPNGVGIHCLVNTRRDADEIVSKLRAERASKRVYR